MTVSSSGGDLRRVPVFRAHDGSVSVGSPSAPEVDAEGRIRISDAGKKLYWPTLLAFEAKETKDRFQRLMLASLTDAGIAP